MTTSNSFEEAYILYSTMKRIKVKTDEKKTFIIECYTSNYDQKDQWIWKSHSKLFKSDKYLFHPIDDLIKLMSFEFIHNLKPDHFTALPSKWLKNVNIILRKAEVNLIAQMKLYRLLRVNECGKILTESMEYIIYEVKLVNGSNRIVTFEFDLVRDEKSTQGDTNCLSDLGSAWWLEFGWGAKKKGFCTLRKCISLKNNFNWRRCDCVESWYSLVKLGLNCWHWLRKWYNND